MKKKNPITLIQVKKFLNEKGLEVFSKKNKNTGVASFVYTCLASILVIGFFSLAPLVSNLKQKIDINNQEVKNNSKKNLEKILSGKEIEDEENDIDLNNARIFEDIFKIETTPLDTVRLSASTIEQLFKDTNYTLENVRKTKYVKPVALSLLPEEMKMIESTKKRKKLFIKIVLPLILEENKKIQEDRKKLFSILNKNNNSTSEKKWLNQKFKQYGVSNKDLITLKIRMDEIPVSLTIAQAAKETGWGTSRFALEGNALFGQWTWGGAGIKPLKLDSDQNHKVMKFKILKASVRAYQRNLNTHSSYREFRKIRAVIRDNDEKLDSLILADYLDKYAETGKEYTKILKQIIKQNRLKDFDEVKLMPSTIKEKNKI